MKPTALADSAHLMTLVGFALAQPLYDLLGRNAAFFVFHQAQPLDILLLVLLVSLVVPALIAGFVLLLPGRRRTVPVALALLTALVLIPMLGRLATLPALVVIALALLGGAAFSWCRSRYRVVRSFMLALTPAFVVFPVLFLSGAQVARLLHAGSEVEIPTGIRSETPVVMLIFDEFPLISLLDDKQEIDAVRYPNFAALANRSHWFRNATTAHPWTIHAMPTLVTGKYTKPAEMPTAGDHVQSLFTLLGNSHELRVQEYGSLCPEQLNTCKTRPAFGKRMKNLLHDLAIVEAHLLLPNQWTKDLPAIDVDWGHFGDTRQALLDRPRQFTEFLGRLTPPENKPGLHFLHITLPHTPYSFLPSGKGYGRDAFVVGLGRNKKWLDDEDVVIRAQQRHLLQVAYADRLVGDMIARLRETGLYNKCLLVVTADHGCSFSPGGPYRKITEDNYADILRVPLFVKKPNQKDGVLSDRNVQHIDVMPTIADVLGARIPWPVDGRSMFGDISQEWPSKLVLENGEPHEYSRSLNDSFGGHVRQLARFGSGPWQRFHQSGPSPSLIGTKATERSSPEAAWVKGQLMDTAGFANVSLVSSFIPARIRGSLTRKDGEAASVPVAIAVNGTVRATTRVRIEAGKEANWEVMVSEDSFKEGKNTVEVYEIAANDDLLLVTRTGSVEDSSDYRLDGDNLVGPDGRKTPIRKHVFEGCLDVFHQDQSCVTFAGWSADPRGGTLPERIVLLADGQPFHSGPLHAEREDIAKLWKDNRYRWCGYNFSLPRERFAGLEGAEFRLFAISSDGRASELRYQDWYKRRAKRPLQR